MRTEISMRIILAIVLAVIYGFLLRAAFGIFDRMFGLMSIMSMSFLIVLPFAIGFVTIILIPKERNRSATSCFFKPWISSLGILAITIVLDMEGTICWIIIFPLFATLAGIGGLFAYDIQKKRKKQEQPDWDEHDILRSSVLLLLPLFFGVLEGDHMLSKKEMIISTEVEIDASAKDVWNTLTATSEISSSSKGFSLMNAMGFPKHVNTTLDTLKVGGKRMAYYEKGLYFQETIAAYEPGKSMVLDIKTDPAAISPKVMDEHIVIGGKYVNILQDVYTLQRITDKRCTLTLSSRFYINTPFNWYTGIWARFLMKDILQGELNIIKEKVVGK